MGRSYRLGRKKVTQAEFDTEVVRLRKAGLTEPQIASRLGRERTAIWRSLKRGGAERGTLIDEQGKVEAQYQALVKNKCLALPELEAWLTGLTAMRSFLLGTGRATRDELKNAGIDAKHHETGGP